MIQTKYINNLYVSYVIADPKTDDIDVAFKLGATVKDLGQGSDVSANFNFADNKIGKPIGLVICNGKTVISDEPKTVARDSIYMLPDRTLHIGKPPKGTLWSVQGSPPLLKDGKKVFTDGIKRDQTGTDIWQTKSFRLAAGLTKDRKLVVVRTQVIVSLDTLSELMLTLGCVDALNGDGGGSAYLYPEDNGWGRLMGCALTIKKGVVVPMTDIKIIQDFIPVGRNNRSRYALKPEFITIHGTGNKAATADAKNHALFLKGDSAAASPVSWHYTVDDKPNIYQHLPTNENGWHAGDGTNGPGNRKSIGIEICEFAGINVAAAESNAAKLVAKLMVEFNLSISAVVQHNKWSGKNCPEFLRKAGAWDSFIAKVKDELKKNDHLPNEGTPPVLINGFNDIAGHWALDNIKKVLASGVMVGVSADRFAPDEPLTRAQMATLLVRLGLDKGVK